MQSGAGDDSAIDLDIGPHVDGSAVDNYRTIKTVLARMTQLCVRETGTSRKPRKHEQRLLRNMGVHVAVLDLLRIPYDKVLLCLLLVVFLNNVFRAKIFGSNGAGILFYMNYLAVKLTA